MRRPATLVGAGRPAVIASVDTLLQLPGLVRDLAALNIPVIPTPAASGVIIAVDVAGLLLDGARIEVATARHANLTLTDGAGGSPGRSGREPVVAQFDRVARGAVHPVWIGGGRVYDQNSVVTHRGSMWVAKRATSAPPAPQIGN
jgi:hypothetical protein